MDYDARDLPAHLHDDFGRRARFPSKSKLLRHIRHPFTIDVHGPLLEETSSRASGVLIGKRTHD
jgi:hypothetical protein